MLSPAEIALRYAYPLHLEKPWMRVNFVSSLDGAAQDASGVSGSLGGPDDTAIFAVLRSIADVIIVGAGTARTEGYRPVLTSEIHQDLRAQVTDSPTPPIAIVSSSLDVPEYLVATDQILITNASSDVAKRSELATAMDVIVAGDNVIDWHLVMRELAERKLFRLLCEGGPNLHGDLIALDLVDELCLSVATVLVGGEAKRISSGPVGPKRSMQLADTIVGEGVLATRWLRDRDPTTA